MTRVWLAEWEWACCGDPFVVGDEVDFGIRTRTVHPGLADTLGPAISDGVDAIESHHEDESVDRVRGLVTAVNLVTHEVVERKTLRRPGHGGPPTADMPSDGEAWPITGREMGNGVFVGSRPSRYMIEIVPVAGTSRLEPTGGVGLLRPAQDNPLPGVAELLVDRPPKRRARSQVGWLIDVDEH